MSDEVFLNIVVPIGLTVVIGAYALIMSWRDRRWK